MDVEALAVQQHGVLTRGQALEGGLSPGALRSRLRTGRWQRVHPGIYLTHGGVTSWLARASAALLHCGPGAALALETAAHLLGLDDRQPPVLHLAVPWERKVVRVPGSRVRRRRRLVTVRRQRLTVTSAAQTVVDLAAEPGCSADDAVAVAARACQLGRTKSEQLLAELALRARHQHRDLMVLALGDAEQGVESVGEFRFLQHVVRRHGLPAPTCQAPTADGRGRRDFEWVEYGLIAEVDGLQWHQGQAFHRDRRRDRRAARDGKITLRSGWFDVTADPCELAIDLGLALQQRGWPGRILPCSPSCPVHRLGPDQRVG